jgi:hypothetical protein
MLQLTFLLLLLLLLSLLLLLLHQSERVHTRSWCVLMLATAVRQRLGSELEEMFS